jgi:O-antigen/teichoic acid export membrane protein
VLIGLVILFIVGSLTVGSAAAVYLVASVATALIVVPVLRHQQFRFDRQTVRDAIPFGARAWVGTTADLANIRLDQLLMVTLVSSHELGLYAVAVSIGGFAWVMTEGMAPPLLARISAGEVGLAPRALRAGLSVIGLLTVLAAIATPLLLTVLFGSEFTDARDPSWILLAAGIPFAGTVILTQTLNGVGRPGLPAIGQAVALMITVPGLLLLLPPMGAVGAAVVSLIAYTANLMVLLVATIRTCDMSLSELLVPRRGDFSWAFELVRARLRTWRGGSEITPRAADSR